MTTAEALAALDEVIASTPAAGRPALVVELSSKVAAAAAGMALPASTNGNCQEAEDRNLSAKEAARRLGVSLPYLYKHAGEYPFARRIGSRVVFDRRGLEAWNCRQHPRLTAESLDG